MLPVQILQHFNVDVYGGAILDKPRFIRIALFDDVNGPRCYNGLAAQLAGDTWACTAFLLKTLETTESAKQQGISEYTFTSAAEWEWNGGEDLVGEQLEEAKRLYASFCMKLQMDKENDSK